MSTGRKKDYLSEGKFGAAIHPRTLRETDNLRGDIPRSRWIERALIQYNESIRKGSSGGDEERNSTIATSQTASQVGSQAEHSATVVMVSHPNKTSQLREVNEEGAIGS